MSAYVTQATTAMHRRRIDGTRWISIRPIERTDALALSEFYAGLSPESRRRRFLCGGGPQVAMIARLADAPGVVGVLREIGPHDGSIVAHASVQPDGCDGGEVAFVVADEYQRLGLGRLLVGAAVRLARGLGLGTVQATLLADNAPMRHLLRSAGIPVLSDRLDAGTEEIVLDLARAA